MLTHNRHTASEGRHHNHRHYPGQILMSNAKLLPKAYDAIEDIAAVLRAANE
jgi:hypothetical protein